MQLAKHLRACSHHPSAKEHSLFPGHFVLYFLFNLCVVIKQLRLEIVDQSVFAFLIENSNNDVFTWFLKVIIISITFHKTWQPEKLSWKNKMHLLRH